MNDILLTKQDDLIGPKAINWEPSSWLQIPDAKPNELHNISQPKGIKR